MNSRGSDGRFIARRNLYRVNGEMAECYLEDGSLLFFTDAKLINKIKKYSWSKLANGYASANVNGEQIPAHRLLTNAPDGKIVDHINRNKKDNRLCNLRVCGKSLNAMNSKKRYDNKSGRTGVWYRKDTNKWVAEIKFQYKKISLGCFENIEDAIKAREEAEYEYQFEAERQGW